MERVKVQEKLWFFLTRTFFSYKQEPCITEENSELKIQERKTQVMNTRNTLVKWISPVLFFKKFTEILAEDFSKNAI